MRQMVRPQANTGVMGVAREAATLAAAGLVEELKAEGEEEARTNSTNALGLPTRQSRSSHRGNRR